jgi:hypothetical protein
VRLALSFEGLAPQPFEHYVGRLSEEFGGMPCSQVIEELERLPAGFMEQVIEYRRFGEAWQAMKRAETKDQREAMRGKGWTMFDLAEMIEIDIEVANQHRRDADKGKT